VQVGLFLASYQKFAQDGSIFYFSFWAFLFNITI